MKVFEVLRDLTDPDRAAGAYNREAEARGSHASKVKAAAEAAKDVAKSVNGKLTVDGERISITGMNFTTDGGEKITYRIQHSDGDHCLYFYNDFLTGKKADEAKSFIGTLYKRHFGKKPGPTDFMSLVDKNERVLSGIRLGLQVFSEHGAEFVKEVKDYLSDEF